MTWNYRLLKYENGYLMLHEVYYDDDDEIYAYTMDPITFGGEDKEGAIKGLQMALDDATKYPVLDKEEVDTKLEERDAENGSTDTTTEC